MWDACSSISLNTGILERPDEAAGWGADLSAVTRAAAHVQGSTKKELKGASKQMEKSMSEGQLEDFAHTKRKGKPEHAAR